VNDPITISASQPPSLQDSALCIDCGYSLRGLITPRCPECGRAFDPDNAFSMNVGRKLSEIQKWILKSDGRITVSLAWIAFAASLLAGMGGRRFSIGVAVELWLIVYLLRI